MKILFVHSIGKSKYGGGERWVVNAASGLLQRGHTVYAAVRENSVLGDELHRSGVSVIPFNLYSNLSLYQALRLVGIIFARKIDVVICKGQELIVSGLAVKFSKNTVLIRRTGSPPRRRSRKLIWRTKFFVDGVVTNTLTIKDVYHQYGFTEPGFVRVIYNGLTMDDKIDPFDFSAHYPGKTIVLCLGRAVAEKGYFYLIDALPSIKKAHPDLFFYVLGEGKDRTRLMAYAAEKSVADMIKFAGYEHNPKPYLKGCDFFLHSSLFEGMPNAAMEAMAFGKPVILTRVNGAEELTANGKYARLIPPADAAAIIQAVKEAMQHKEAFMEMGVEAQKFVKKKFGMNTMVDQLEEFISDRLNNEQKRKNHKPVVPAKQNPMQIITRKEK